jgi:hypothetical protein
MFFLDPKGEKLDFPYEKVNHKKINPTDSGRFSIPL